MQLVALAKGGSDSGGNRLLLDWADEQQGNPAADRAVAEQAFGEHLWPHLFRHCAATELVDSAPHKIAIAPDLLGDADLETTQRYYVLAEGMTAMFGSKR